ncbi:5721_t:CDS:2, partial [Acaulospora colombiana]
VAYPGRADRYTSLGSTFNTFRNPALREANGQYKPAYELKDGSQERMGRRNLSFVTYPFPKTPRLRTMVNADDRHSVVRARLRFDSETSRLFLGVSVILLLFYCDDSVRALAD